MLTSGHIIQTAPLKTSTQYNQFQKCNEVVTSCLPIQHKTTIAVSRGYIFDGLDTSLCSVHLSLGSVLTYWHSADIKAGIYMPRRGPPTNTSTQHKTKHDGYYPGKWNQQ